LTTIIQDYRKGASVPKQIIVLLHGYGSNGQDLISLAPYFAQNLPDAVFISPDAPFPCEIGVGFQWFSLAEYTPEKLLEGTLAAHPLLDNYLDKLLEEYNLSNENMALIGFSQGTMMSLYTGLRRKSPISGILGYSGALIGAETLPNDENKPPICLIHGESDSVVPVVRYHDARAQLEEKGYVVSGQTTPNLGHSIDEEGIKSGQNFLSKILNNNKSL
jgi:phospholipase/carboxylesterase